MDPIHPIAPGPPAISHAGSLPVQRLERVSRERDRPAKDTPERKRREPPPSAASEPDTDDEGRPHIDVRA